MNEEYKSYHSGFSTLLKGIAVVLIILFLCIRSCVSFATTRYISTGGNDVSGNGSFGNPYASLLKACAVSVPGDIVHVIAGTYVQSAQQVIVPVNVSIEGEGANNTIINLTYSLAGFNGFNMASIQLVSTTPNTNGNQSISNIRFNGNSYQCFAGILVKARGGVIIRNCTFSQFGITAVNLNGKTGQNTGTDPIEFADGNQVLNCTFLDCNDRILQQANSVSCGSISIAGQTNLLIQDDTLRNINNRQGHNGDLICGVQGNNKNSRFVNLICQKPEDEGASFNFSFEIWYSKGNNEISGCTFIGGGDHLDFGYGDLYRGTFAHSWSILNNTFTNPAPLTSAQNLLNVTAGFFVTGKAYQIKSIGTTNFMSIGATANTVGLIFTASGPGAGTGTANASHPTESIAIQFEPSTNTSFAPINPTIGDVVIQNNHCRNIGTFLQITLNNYNLDFVRNIQADHNDGTFGYANGTYSAAINFTISTGLKIDSTNFENNTFVSLPGVGCLKGIVILQPDAAGSTISNFRFINDIADGCASGYGYFVFRGSQACSNISIQNTIAFQNAFTNNYFVFSGTPAPVNLVSLNIIKLDPKFVSSTDFHLTATSPAIGTGLNPPATYIGAYPSVSPNQSPIADAGTNKNITLPTTSVTQVGSGTDPDGTIAAYNWTVVSGPVIPTFGSVTSATTTINGMSAAGVYIIQLQVTDNLGSTAIDTASVVVNASAPPNLPPVVNAGGNKNITLPTSTVTQTGSATDPDGTISGYAWSQDAGNPIPANIVSATSATTVINGMTVGGIYTFTLRATDNLGAVGSQTISVIVNPPTPVSPVAHAGTDQTITWPANSVTLSGSGTDADGTIVGYSWQKTSGGAAAITAASSASTTVTGLSVGVYQFQLTVIDNSGLTATDVVQITVNRGSASLSFVTGTLSQHYTGLPLMPQVVTSPAGLAFNLTLNGTSGGKINVNTYAAVAGGNDPNWTFTPISATFEITQDSSAVIHATNKTVFYDGNRQNITGTTTPAGIPLAYLYDGADEPGGVTGPGVFDVFIFTASDNYWAPPIHRTLTININPSIIAISDTIFTYDGSPHAVTVTSDYTYSVTYNGSATPPTNVTSGVQVIATITDGVHTGADTANMIIIKRDAVLSWNKPLNAPYGTLASTTNLNPISSIAGTFTFNVPYGYQFVLGSNVLVGTFTPADPANNNGGTISTTIDIFAVNPIDTKNYFIIGPDGIKYVEQ